MILGDSSINPRSFPQKDRTELEETYPYILKERYKEFVFWQLALGGVETELLVSQAASYLVHWNPDIIIVHSGIVDCFPRSFSAGEILVIQKLSRRLFRYIKKYLNHPSLIKWRQKERASKKSFQKTAKKLKAIFKNSTIFWMEICAEDNLEERAPGLKKKERKL